MSGLPSRVHGDARSRIRELLEAVRDPEIPVLGIADLGVLREINVTDDGVEVVITPTYSGCPAMETIEQDILERLAANGYPCARVRTVLAPAWSTDDMSDAARDALARYGIAPPVRGGCADCAVAAVACPRCGSAETELVSEFGSTACKAHFRCRACLEPFEYFKCL